MLGQLVVFNLDAHRYAVRLEFVRRVVRVAEPTPLPNAPDIVLGVLNLRGEIIPVLDIRRRLGLPRRDINPTDQLIVASTARRRIALLVESVSGVAKRSPDEITKADEIMPGVEYLEGVSKLEDGILLIYDLDRFLSLDEEIQLEGALDKS